MILPVSVTDPSGHFVPGLSKENFQVLEDEQPQKITIFHHDDIPVTVGLVVDRSGSMGRKMDEVRNAAIAFADMSNPQDEIFVVDFNERASLALPAGEAFTSSATQLREALGAIRATGRTALNDAVALALHHLEQGGRDKQALLVISDGGDNASKESFKQVLTMAQHSPALIYTIGLFDENDADWNPGALRKLAQVSGGRAYFPKSTGEVTGICEEIARDLRQQYMIGFAPAGGESAGKFRAVRVKAIAPGHRKLTVRTRTGFFVPTAGAESHSVSAKAMP